MRTLRAIILSLFLLPVAIPAWGRVFLQWTEPAIPSAASIGVNELVVPWGPGKIPMMVTAKKRGYRVFARVKTQDAGAAADAATANGLAGVIVEGDSDTPGQGNTHEVAQKLRNSHPGLSVLELDPGGKEPQIGGNMVVRRHGVMGVSSPTRQPWIDSNAALTRYEQTYQPGQAPLFSFSWDLTDPLERQEGPRAADYALAVAEAGAMHADLIMPIHPSLQRALAGGNKTAWREWELVKTYASFYSKVSAERSESRADVAVVTNNYEDTYEAMNLLSRRNIPFRVLRPGEVAPRRLSRFQVVLMFSRPEEPAARVLQAFSSAGGTVVLIAQHGPFPWETLPSVKTSDGTRYKVGRGQIVELAQPVEDPGALAEKVRGFLHQHGPLIYLWNAMTTLSFVYAAPQGGGMTLELVNYAQEPLQVQVRVKGSFPNIRYATPEHGFYPAVHPELDNGFTQFVISHLTIGARVYLGSEVKQPK